jgi:hypothetical protein
MKQLIRKILKEETQEEKNAELGMKILTSVIKKRFPFIKGLKMGQSQKHDPNKFYFDVYFIIDVEKTKEFYNSELLSVYKDYPEFLVDGTHPYPFSILELRNELDSDEKYQLFKELKNEVDDVYESLPTEMIPKVEWNQSTYDKEISIEGFIIE